MRKTPSIDRNNPKIISKINNDIELEARRFDPRRVRQIENTLGVRITPAPNEVLKHGMSDAINHHDQAIQLLRAFELITDTKVRADLLAMVIAAAQHESEPD